MLARAFAVRESEDDKQPRMGKPIDDVDAPDLATPINRPQQRRRCSHPRVPDPYWRSKSGAISFDLLAVEEICRLPRRPGVCSRTVITAPSTRPKQK